MINGLSLAFALLLASLPGARANIFTAPVASLSLAKHAVAGSPAHVQGCQTANGATASTTIVCTFGAVVSGGDIVTLFVGLGSSAQVASASDDKGDTCSVVDSQAPVGYTTASLYCANVTAGARTFTVTASAANSYSVVLGDEYSNVAVVSPIDAHAKNYQANPGAGSNAVTTGSVQTMTNGDLIVGGTFAVGAAGSITAGARFLQRAYVSNLAMAESTVQAAAGAAAATWTGNASSGFQSHLLALRPNGGGGPQNISGVTLSNATFAPGAPAGTVIGTVSTAMSPASPPFGGTLSLSGTTAADFQIVGSNLETAVGGLGAGNYSLTLVATQTSAANSPYSQPQTITAASGSATNHKGIQSFNGQPQYYPASYVSSMITRWQAAGVAWARVPVLQIDLDPSCTGTLNFGALGSGVGIDSLVSNLASVGIEPLFLVGGVGACNSSTGAAGGWIPPANTAIWANNFAAKVAAHEGPLGHHNYEIWNEENGSWDWPPAANAGQYVALLCAVYSAIHAADPSANVIVGGLSGTQGTTILDTTYLSQMYAAGAHGCFDAIADHPYPDNGPTNNVLRGGTNNWDRMYFTNPSLHSIMAANGDGSKKIWVTEIGCGTAGQSISNGYQITACPDQAHQAQMVTDAFNYAANGFPNLGPIVWWEDHDTNGATCNAFNTTPLDSCSGLWDGNLNPKSAVTAYKNASGIW
jgi:hypothetical protein